MPATPTTESLLHRYFSGELTAPQEAELERRALTDEALREALEGLREVPEADHAARVAAMVDRVKPVAVRRSLLPRYAAAASVLLLLGLAVFLLPRYVAESEEAIAQITAPAAPPPATTPAPASTLTPAETEVTVDEPIATTTPPPVQEYTLEDLVETEEEAIVEALPHLDAAPAPASSNQADVPTPSITRILPAARKEQAQTLNQSRRPTPPAPVRGYVTTDDGEAIAGASLVRPGQALGVTTDSSGAFELPYDATLREFTVSAEGYETEELEVLDPTSTLQISLSPVERSERMEAFLEAAARQRVNIDPAMPVRGQARPTEGYRNLRERIENDKPAGLPVGKVRVTFLVDEDGELSDFRFRGTDDRQLMDYIGEALIESSKWEVITPAFPSRGAAAESSVRVYLKLRFE